MKYLIKIKNILQRQSFNISASLAPYFIRNAILTTHTEHTKRKRASNYFLPRNSVIISVISVIIV